MLEPKQELFVKEFLVDLNATQAAVRAGYSAKTARQMGAENLSKPVIQAAIRGALQKRVQKLNLTTDRILRGIMKVAFGKNRGTSDRDRLKALELLGKYKKLFTEKLEVTDKSGVAEKLRRARERRERTK